MLSNTLFNNLVNRLKQHDPSIIRLYRIGNGHINLDKSDLTQFTGITSFTGKNLLGDTHTACIFTRYSHC
jgi:hypothetical protein